MFCVGFLTSFSVLYLYAYIIKPDTPDEICQRIAELSNAATGVTLPTQPSDVIEAFLKNYDLVSEVCETSLLLGMS